MTTDLASNYRPKVPVTRPERFGNWIGVSESLTHLFAELRERARGDTPIVLQGEEGVGKQALLRELHRMTPGDGRPLVVVSCGSVPSHLVRAELFGNSDSSEGAFQRAAGGDLLLADITALPLDVQTTLADALTSAVAQPRLLASSAQSIDEQFARGWLSESLHRILSKHCLALPPLRARRDDIVPLAIHFLSLCQDESKSSMANFELGSSALEALAVHDWPGNARELKTVVESAATPNSREAPMLPTNFTSPQPTNGHASGFDPQLSYRETRAQFEAEFETRYVRWLLERHSGNISAASREARMDRKYLYDLARKHGLRGQRSR